MQLCPKNYKYAINELPEMKSAIHDWYQNRYGVQLEDDEMICLQGSQEALSTCFWLLAMPGRHRSGARSLLSDLQ